MVSIAFTILLFTIAVLFNDAIEAQSGYFGCPCSLSGSTLICNPTTDNILNSANYPCLNEQLTFDIVHWYFGGVQNSIVIESNAFGNWIVTDNMDIQAPKGLMIKSSAFSQGSFNKILINPQVSIDANVEVIINSEAFAGITNLREIELWVTDVKSNALSGIGYELDSVTISPSVNALKCHLYENALEGLSAKYFILTTKNFLNMDIDLLLDKGFMNQLTVSQSINMELPEVNHPIFHLPFGASVSASAISISIDNSLNVNEPLLKLLTPTNTINLKTSISSIAAPIITAPSCIVDGSIELIIVPNANITGKMFDPNIQFFSVKISFSDDFKTLSDSLSGIYTKDLSLNLAGKVAMVSDAFNGAIISNNLDIQAPKGLQINNKAFSNASINFLLVNRYISVDVDAEILINEYAFAGIKNTKEIYLQATDIKPNALSGIEYELFRVKIDTPDNGKHTHLYENAFQELTTKYLELRFQAMDQAADFTLERGFISHVIATDQIFLHFSKIENATFQLPFGTNVTAILGFSFTNENSIDINNHLVELVSIPYYFNVRTGVKSISSQFMDLPPCNLVGLTYFSFDQDAINTENLFDADMHFTAVQLVFPSGFKLLQRQLSGLYTGDLYLSLPTNCSIATGAFQNAVVQGTLEMIFESFTDLNDISFTGMNLEGALSIKTPKGLLLKSGKLAQTSIANVFINSYFKIDVDVEVVIEPYAFVGISNLQGIQVSATEFQSNALSGIGYELSSVQFGPPTKGIRCYIYENAFEALIVGNFLITFHDLNQNLNMTLEKGIINHLIATQSLNINLPDFPNLQLNLPLGTNVSASNAFTFENSNKIDLVATDGIISVSQTVLSCNIRIESLAISSNSFKDLSCWNSQIRLPKLKNLESNLFNGFSFMYLEIYLDSMDDDSNFSFDSDAFDNVTIFSEDSTGLQVYLPNIHALDRRLIRNPRWKDLKFFNFIPYSPVANENVCPSGSFWIVLFTPVSHSFCALGVSDSPTKSPTPPTKSPTTNPTRSPTSPTRSPTFEPTKSPTNPTPEPTVVPTATPTEIPTKAPTLKPTNSPSLSPSKTPTNTPTLTPSMFPSKNPTTLSPTNIPTLRPSNSPSSTPTTKSPTVNPTKRPETSSPSKVPTDNPTKKPALVPTSKPTLSPVGLCGFTTKKKCKKQKICVWKKGVCKLK